MQEIRNIIRECLEETFKSNDDKIVLKSNSHKGNRYFKMLKTAKFQHYDSPKGELSKFYKGEEDRKRLVSKLSKSDKKTYRDWLKTDEGKESIKLFQNYANDSYKQNIQENNQLNKLSFNDLSKKLLSFGGDRVVEVYEEDLKKLLERGELFDETDSEIVKMRDSQCHKNSACFWRNYTDKNGFDNMSIMTGWALSDDGLWRQHSWLYMPMDDKIIETTEIRDKYFGYILTEEEAEEFEYENY